MRTLLSRGITLLSLTAITSAAWGGNDSAPSTPYEEANDSTQKVTELEAVTVEAKDRINIGSTSVFIPSKREKNYAAGGIDVLTNLAIPELKINPLSNDVVCQGENVQFFIDFVPASQKEIENLRPQDIKKIELLHYPQDPRFRNAKIALNYIMVKYDYGGYTKVSGLQYIRNNRGNYSLASKMSYKKMSYELWAGYGYSSSGHTSSTTENIYRFGDTEVSRYESPEWTRMRSQSENVTGKITYQSDNTVISNIVGGSFSQMPRNNMSGSLTFMPNVYPDQKYSSLQNSRSNGAEWSGNYYFPLPRNFSLNIDPQLNYYRSYANSNYMPEDAPDIVTDTRESNLYGSLNLGLAKFFGNHSLSASLRSSYSWNKAEYDGTTKSVLRNEESSNILSLNGAFMFNNIMFYIRPGLDLNIQKIDGTSYRFFSPEIFAGAYWRPHNNHAFTLRGEYHPVYLNASLMNPTVILKNELEARAGNPDLKRSELFAESFFYDYQINQMFSLSVDENLMWQNRAITTGCEQTDFQGRDVILGRNINDGKLLNFDVGAGFSARLFGKKLVIDLNGGYKTMKKTGMISHSYSAFKFSGNVMAYLGPVRLRAYYATREKGGNAYWIYSTRNYYFFEASWAYKGLYIAAYAMNPFTSTRKNNEYTAVSPLVYMHMSDTGPAYSRYFGFKLTYSLHYGKKTKEEREITISGRKSIINPTN